MTNLYYPLISGFVLFVVFAVSLRNEEPPSWFILIIVMGVAGGLMWTYLLIGTLIDILDAIGIIFNIDATYLGLTVLAVGNALPDALTTISLCK